jgi:23S rRNA (guanosine2251-2'-O)-methyltransferase
MISMTLYGINPVLEALRARRVTSLRISTRADNRIADVVRLAEEQRVKITRVPPQDLDRAVGGHRRHRHQGVVAEARESESLTIEDLLSGTRDAPLIVVLDGIEDPHNFGAILRTADAAGAHGVVRQSRRAAPLGGAAAKASAGASAYVKIADVVNIARALEELKDAGVWTIGLAGDGETTYDSIDFTLPTAVVVGAEGSGLRRLVRERCDWVVAIPLQGRMESLNASVAAGIVLFEAVRQRRAVSAGSR